jgi:hypothetical protein
MVYINKSKTTVANKWFSVVHIKKIIFVYFLAVSCSFGFKVG